MIRAVAISVVVALVRPAVGDAPKPRPASAEVPVRIMRCIPKSIDITNAIETVEIFRDRKSDLGLFVITSMNGSRASAFAHLSFTHDRDDPTAIAYLQAFQAMRDTETHVGFNFLARVGTDQAAVLRRPRGDHQPEDLRFVCDSAATLAAR
jgi:hypothetical protein